MVSISLDEMLVLGWRVPTQFYLMREDQLILLAESNEISASLWLAQAVLPHAKEGQLTLLTEPYDNLTPGSKAFTVLPHVGGEDWANHKAVELLPRVACPSPPSLTSSRTPTEGRLLPQQVQ